MYTSNTYLVLNEPGSFMRMGYCDSEQRTEKNKRCIIEKESTLIIYICVCYPRSYSVYGFHAKKKKKL